MEKITKVGDGKNFVERERLAMLPSLMASNQAPGLSGRYRQYNTMAVIDRLMENGWFPVRASE